MNEYVYTKINLFACIRFNYTLPLTFTSEYIYSRIEMENSFSTKISLYYHIDKGATLNEHSYSQKPSVKMLRIVPNIMFQENCVTYKQVYNFQKLMTFLVKKSFLCTIVKIP